MIPETPPMGNQQRARRELLRRYVGLQRELAESDPGSTSYQGTIQAFRQMGYTLIAAGLEEDLDRLLRIRVLDGGRKVPAPRRQRPTLPVLHVIEQVKMR